MFLTTSQFISHSELIDNETVVNTYLASQALLESLNQHDYPQNP